MALDFLILIRSRIINENLLLFIVLKVLTYFHDLSILFENIIWLWHRKISFFIIFRRMKLAFSIFLTLNIWRCHNHTLSLNHHLLILFLHHLQFLLKHFFFVNIFLKLLLRLQSLAKYFLLSCFWVLLLILLIYEWILSKWKSLIVVLNVYKITNIIAISVLSLALYMRIILIVELSEVVTRILVARNLLGLHLSLVIILKMCVWWVHILLIKILNILLIVNLIRRVFIFTFIFVINIVTFYILIWESYGEISCISFYNRVINNFILLVGIICEWVLP